MRPKNKKARVATSRFPIELEAGSQEAEEALARLSKFIQFPTVSAAAPSSGAYKDCATWLVEQLNTLLPNLEQVFLLPEAPENSPVVVAYWKGRDPTLPVLLLNSHYDVVPAVESDWTVPPFAGIRKQGKVYGRGAQDMKCVCLQYIEALRQLCKLHGPQWKPHRSIYLTFVPDEEIGGSGMAAFLDSKTYKSLPGIALALDEGLASTNDTYSVFYGERTPWWVEFTATGPTGHGSRFIDNTAVEQIIDLSNKAMAFRKGQREQLLGLDDHQNCAHAVAAKTLGDVTSLNITTLEAGVKVGGQFAVNCVPPTAKATMDIRISPLVSVQSIKDMINVWCQECSKSDEHKVEWKFEANNGEGFTKHFTTSTDKAANPWYAALESALTHDMGIAIKPQVFPAATDSRFLRALGIRALGFSPMRNTEIMLHEVDEYIPEDVYLEGIAVYVGLLDKLSTFQEPDETKTHGGQ